MKAAKTPETGAKGLYVSKKSRQNQDLPMTENQKHRHGGPPRGLPLVGAENISIGPKSFMPQRRASKTKTLL
jgi:hypothetical protein